jgi:subtilisin-like proprotein convertase family protein
MPTNTDPFIIGKYYSALGYFNGRMDELRAWNVELSPDNIKYYMFNSCRAGTMPGLIAAWNFDGNLINFGSTTGINGSFNTGGTNNCRFSAFSNETSSGVPGISFLAHPTVVNRTATPNPFPGGFAIKAPFKPIVDVATTRDTIVIGGAGTVTSVELFLSVAHTFCADMDIVLRAPNGQTRDISSDNGSSSGSGYLTFFVDGQTAVSNAAFLPPYSNLAGPEVAMGSMGSSATNGLWILEITDDLGGDSGTLRGWGIRLNGAVTGIQPVTNNLPNKFNLAQNYPNPFNPITNIRFDIPKDVNVKLVIYDILGKEVKSLVNEFTKAGEYKVQFDATNIASGTYFYRLEAGDFVDVKKLVVIK